MNLTVPIIIIALLFLAFLYAAKRNARIPADLVPGTKILVCSIGAATADNLEDTDAKVYSTYYRQVDVMKGQSIDALIASIRGGGYDVLHLFCELGEDGDLVGEQGARLKARDFFDACLRHDMKLLILAGDNPAEKYGQFAQAAGGALAVVMTVSREGDKFPFFLREVMKRMAAGKTLGQAWVAIAPQAGGPWQQKLPSTFALVDRGNIVLPP